MTSTRGFAGVWAQRTGDGIRMPVTDDHFYAIVPNGPHEWVGCADRTGFAVDLLQLFEDYPQEILRSKYKSTNWLWKVFNLFTKVLRRGRFTIYLSDYVIVLRKASRERSER